jgi:hypothetical protein
MNGNSVDAGRQALQICASVIFSARPRTPRHQNFGVPAKNFGVWDAGTHLSGNAGYKQRAWLQGSTKSDVISIIYLAKLALYCFCLKLDKRVSQCHKFRDLSYHS